MITASMDEKQEIERLWDDEEDNLKHEIESFWVEEEEAYGGFASDNLQGNHRFETGNQRIDTGEFHNFEDSGCRRIVLSPGFNLQKVVVWDSRPLLGLTLRKTPSFVSLLEMRLSTPQQAVVPSQDMNQVSDYDRHRASMENVGSQPLSEKLKASNFPISKISIGDWRRLSRNEGDLVAKLYYAKRKMVWEVLDGSLKNKMEILWSDIIAIRAVMRDNQPGTLHIELDKPPLFFRETDPQPRKHTNWQQASDFTGGQAPRFRRHYVIFPPGVLDKHYEKLMQCDQQLFELSQKPFPSLESPFFNTACSMPFDMMISRLSVNFNGVGPRFPQVAQYYPYPAYATASIAAPVQPSQNPTTTVNFAHTNERARNSQAVRQRVNWDQRVHLPRANINFQEPSVFDTAAATPNGGFPNNCHMNYQPLNVVASNEFENHLHLLAGDSQIIMCSDHEGTTHLAQAQSMDSSLILNPINPNNNNAYHQYSGMGYQTTEYASVDQVIMQNATANMPIVEQMINWPPPLQGSNYNSIRMAHEVDPPGNNLPNGDIFSTLYPDQGVWKKY